MGLWLVMENYGFCPKGQFETLFKIKILPVSPFFSLFWAGLLKTASDKNLICQLFRASRVPVIAGFGRLVGIVPFDIEDIT